MVGAVLALVALTGSPRVPAAHAPLPSLMLWAWERPTDLRALPATAGVAFLSQTIILDAEAVDVIPRRQRLLVSPGTPLIAVTRVEAINSGPLDLDDVELTRIATTIAVTSRLPGIRGVQIDFDATLSQRPAYRRLLRAVRAQLGSDAFLSMTALASWCMRDGWLVGLPVDEVVPMLFRMGAGERLPPRLGGSACGGALGTALDEPLPPSLTARRTYVFNAAPWSAASIDAAARRAGQ